MKEPTGALADLLLVAMAAAPPPWPLQTPAAALTSGPLTDLLPPQPWPVATAPSLAMPAVILAWWPSRRPDAIADCNRELALDPAYI